MLAFADLDFRVRVIDAGRLPRFVGKTIRGAFGYALKKSVCVVNHRDCNRCILRSRCAYPILFDGFPPPDRVFMRKYPSIPQPMVVRVIDLEPRRLNAGDTLDFGFRLFGGAIDFFPYLVYSVARIGETGLGVDEFRFEIVSVSDGDKLVYQPDQRDQLFEPLRKQVDVFEEPEPDAPSDLSLRLLTPLRLRSNGRINQSPTLNEILRAALRRLRIMSHFYGDEELYPENVGALLDEASNAKPTHQDLRAISVHRTSTRQNRKMALDAVVGSVDYQLASSRLVPWLRAASECHIGKAASFGFGRVVCEVTKR